MTEPHRTPVAGPRGALASGRVRGVIFDHDGTLVDSLRLVVEATNQVLAEQGHALAEPSIIVADMIYPTPERMGRHARRSDAASQAHLAREFVRVARVTSAAIAPPYRGIPELVASLRGHGLSLGLVSNNDGEVVRRIMREHGLSSAFACLYGDDDMPAPKPDPRGIIKAAAAMQVACDACIYVGDSGGDAQAAHAAGMQAIGVTWGIHPRAAMMDMGFDGLIDAPHELLTLLALPLR